MKLAISPQSQEIVSKTAVIPKAVRLIVARSVNLAIAHSSRPRAKSLAKYEKSAIAIVEIGSKFLVRRETAM